MELTLDEALNKAVEAHKAGQIQEADRLYTAILKAQPKHPDANHNMGVLAVSVGKVQEALPYFKTALKSKPSVAQFWLSYIEALIKENELVSANNYIEQAKKCGLASKKIDILEDQLNVLLVNSANKKRKQNELSPAIELREVGKYQEAQEWLSCFIEKHPNDPEALSLLCHVFLLDEKDVEAGKALSKAISINPHLPSVHWNQARLLLKQSKPLEALEKVQFGYERPLYDPEGWLVLATCLGANQRDQEALPLIEKVLQVIPNHAEALANRALIRLRAKDITGAIKDVEMAVSVKPHLTQMWGLLSSLRYQSKNLVGAIEAAKKAHKFEPNNVNYMIDLGEYLRQDGKTIEAIAILDEAAKLAPGNANTWANLGVAFQQANKTDQAKVAYEKALAINPKMATVFSNLGALAKDSHDWDSHLQYFEQAVALNPEHAELHNNLGGVLKDLGRLEQAEASYKQALLLEPDFAEAHSSLSMILQKMGKLDLALMHAKTSIRLNPESSHSYFNLGIILYATGDFNSALESVEKANFIDSKPQLNRFVLEVLQARKAKGLAKLSVSDINKSGCGSRLSSNPLIVNRAVEAELIAALYLMNSQELDKVKGNDARYGNGRCSPDFDMFKDDLAIIKTVSGGLINIMMQAVKSDVYVYDSFFNILGAGGGTTPHSHLNSIDKDNGLSLANQKFSLVYYLSVGDQNCSEPGNLQLYDPSEEIKLTEGMVVILPAYRKHCAVYNGGKDRIMIGVNFYSLI